MAQAVVEFSTEDGLILMRVTTPWGTAAVLELEPDDARDFSNRLGEAIQHAANLRSDDMPDLSAWLPEDPAQGHHMVPEPEPGAPEAPEANRAELFAGSWLPPSVMRAQYLEDVAEAREARRAEQDRADAAEEAHDRAVAAYAAAAVARGEHVSPVDIAAGRVGRDLADVLSDAAVRMDATQEPPHVDERFYDGSLVQAQRSGWPGSEFELSRMISQAEDSHRWLVAYKARHGGRAAAEAALADRDARRSQMGYQPTPACSDCGYVACQCGVAGAYLPARGRTPMIYR